MDRRTLLCALAATAALPGLLPRALAGLGRADPYALVLGTAQDAGFPQVGCHTDLCELGRSLHAEGRGRYVSSIAIVDPDNGEYFLVDATPDITRQIDLIEESGFRERAAGRRPFDGIFLTHAHIGHYTGLAVLGNEGMGISDTPVYCTARMASFLEANEPWAYTVRQGRIIPTPLTTDRWHRIGERLEVQLWQVPHRDELADTVGFVFRGPSRTLLFLPDINAWSAWDRDLAETVAGLDVALLDASFWSLDELPGRTIDDLPHPLISQTMDLLQGVVDRDAAEVVLTHLNTSNPALDPAGPERAEIERRGFVLAREGMRFGL